MGRHSSSGSQPSRRKPQQIDRISPASTTSESRSEAARRQRKSARIVDPKTRKRRRRRIAITVLVVAAVLVLGSVVGGYAYMRTIGFKINHLVNSDPALAGALESSQTVAPGAPFYAVLMGSDTRPGQSQQRSDSLMVARVDPQKKKIWIISIPRDSRVAIPGKWTTKINAAAVYGGPALVIKTVKQLTGLPITHYINLNFNGFRDVVDAIGGVWVNVPQNIYDTQASAYGAKYATVKKGYQKLDGRHALTFVRTRHTLVDGDFGRMRDQQAFIKALASQAMSLTNVFKASSIIDAVASNLDTDFTPEQLANFALEFKDLKPGDIDTANAPGGAKYVDGISYVILDDVKFANMIDRMKHGLSLVPDAAKTTTPVVVVKASDVPLTVRNGAGVSGLAQQCSSFFVSKGFKISESGNMNQFVYGRTLVIYQKGKADQANFVRQELGFGDVIPSAGMYTFKTSVMVVIGKDWRNPAVASGQ